MSETVSATKQTTTRNCHCNLSKPTHDLLS